MGTKILQHALNPLAADHRCFQLDVHQDCFREERVSSSENYLKRRYVDSYKLQDSVSTMLERHHIESIKQTMLMHEDIFQHQVRELHRLYSVQKRLMNDLRNEGGQSSQHGVRASLDINNPCLGTLAEDMSSGVSSVIEDNQLAGLPHDVELTLSIGPSTGKRTPQSRLRQIGDCGSGAAMKAGKGKDYSDPDSSNMGSSNTLLNQESKRPHWLFQDLSLNRT